MTPGGRIRTTHVGSLPRPDALVELLYAREAGEEPTELDDAVAAAIRDVVARQAAAELDIINDGEQGKSSYAAYVAQRVTGFSPQPASEDRTDFPDVAAHPEFAERRRSEAGRGFYNLPVQVCTGPVSYAGFDDLDRELRILRAAADEHGVEEVFVTAASPGVIPLFLRDQHYGDRDAYLQALVEVMRVEYEAIHAAGFTLQLDCPDLAFGMMWFRDDRDRMRREVARRVEAIDEATAGIPPEAMRMHVCWGNYEGPHHFDVELRDIIDLIVAARPSGLALESANPRHAQDWQVFEDVTLPDGMYLIPGVVDSTTNYIEHPDLVRQRIKSFAKVVGPERVVAGCDCGFGTIAGRPNVVPSIVFAKFESLVEGARRASHDLFG